MLEKLWGLDISLNLVFVHSGIKDGYSIGMTL